MRICFVTTGDIRTNASIRRAVGMTPPLARHGHALAVVAWDTAHNRASLTTGCPEAEVLWLAAGAPALQERREKDQLVRAWRPDVVFLCGVALRNLVPCDGRWLTGRAKAGPACRVVAEHCEWISPDCRHGLRHLVARACNWRSQTAADGLVCASRYLERHYRRVCRSGKPVLYLPYAFTPQAAAGRATPAQPVPGMKRVTYLGAIVQEYGVLELLDGAAGLLRRRADFVVDLLGTGSDASAAQKWVRDAGLGDRIRLHGYVSDDDLPAWLASADVFVAPLHDTRQDRARCPSKLYAYLPYAKPIVTCQVGEAAELLGTDGFYYRPDDGDDLARVLDRALDASGSWQPRAVNLADQTWDARAATFERWLQEAFGAGIGRPQ